MAGTALAIRRGSFADPPCVQRRPRRSAPHYAPHAMPATLSVQTLFGLPLPSTHQPIPEAVARTLAQRLVAAANALSQDTPAARAATVRREAADYLAARRGGTLQIAGVLRGRCDDAARAILQRTLNAPPMPTASAQLLVA